MSVPWETSQSGLRGGDGGAPCAAVSVTLGSQPCLPLRDWCLRPARMKAAEKRKVPGDAGRLYFLFRQDSRTKARTLTRFLDDDGDNALTVTLRAPVCYTDSARRQPLVPSERESWFPRAKRSLKGSTGLTCPYSLSSHSTQSKNSEPLLFVNKAGEHMRSIGNVTVTCKSLLMPSSTSVPARSLSAPGLLNSGRMERPWGGRV